MIGLPSANPFKPQRFSISFGNEVQTAKPRQSGYLFLQGSVMGVRSAFLLVIVLLIAALAALNWATLATPAVISLGFMQATAPLGLLMLGLTAALAVCFLIYVLYLQSSVLLETRRHTRELTSQRDLAEKAEASRFTELRGFLESQEQKRSARHAELHAVLLARVDQSDHTLAAHFGQLEDRLDRRDGRPTAEI